ncbi:MAG: hypothetical protein U1E78_00125 [Gammaproteobacteria bacterium]
MGFISKTLAALSLMGLTLNAYAADTMSDRIARQLQSEDFLNETAVVDHGASSNLTESMLQPVAAFDETTANSDDPFLAANEVQVNIRPMVQATKSPAISKPKAIAVSHQVKPEPKKVYTENVPQAVVSKIETVEKPIQTEKLGQAKQLPPSESIQPSEGNDSSTTETPWWKPTFKPYLGLAKTARHMAFEKGSGENFFNQTLHATEVFGGINLNKYLDLEFGYAESNKRHKANFASSSETIFNVLLNDYNDSLGFHNNSKFSAARANLIGKIPVKFIENMSVELGAGITRLKTYNQSTYDSFNGEQNPVEQSNTVSFVKSKNILNLMAGVNYKIFPHLGLRASVIYDQSSKLNRIGPPIEILTAVSSIKPKNAMTYGIGVYVTE